jgi:hypothetical protein
MSFFPPQTSSWSRAPASFWSVAHGLNVVSVVVENESGIVVQMVVRAKPRGPVILAARRERGSVELIDGWPIFRYEGDVHWLFQLSFVTNPEIRLTVAAKTCSWLTRLFSGRLHD